MEQDHMPAPRPQAGGGDGSKPHHAGDNSDILLLHKRRDQEPLPPPPLPHAVVAPQNHFYSKLGQQLPLHPPPSYSFADSPAKLAHISFPEVPATELPPIKDINKQGDRFTTLPSFSTLTSSQPPASRGVAVATNGATAQASEASHAQPTPQSRATIWPSANPLSVYYVRDHAQAADSPNKMDHDVSSNGTMSAASPDKFLDGRASSVSLDDPDVRLAAEALGDLRADFVSSPPNRHTPLPGSPPSANYGSPQPAQPEPLLSLLTTSHPLLATTIVGATSAYNNSKNFSPRFKSSAEYVEGYLVPIANTVGNMGRATGVEGGVRWFLGGNRRPQQGIADLEAGEGGSHKRRKVDASGAASLRDEKMGPPGFDPFAPTARKDRRLSTTSTIDTLPAYDEFRSPAYTESVEARDTKGGATAGPSDPQMTPERQGSTSQAWQSRLIMSTSGLSVAMSEESLRSLKYCLQWLRWANDHIAGAIDHLKTALDQYDGPDAAAQAGAEGELASSGGGEPLTLDAAQPEQQQAADRAELAGRIAALRNDVLRTIRDMIETVSRYAGGALPDNARSLVRRHLTSLPQRFWLASAMEAQQAQSPVLGDDGAAAAEQGGASSSSSSSSSTTAAAAAAAAPPARSEKREQEQDRRVKGAAQRVLLLAKESMDMMAQISGVLDGTIVSAEEWCDRLGRSKRPRQEEGEGDDERETADDAEGDERQRLVEAAPNNGDVDVKMG